MYKNDDRSNCGSQPVGREEKLTLNRAVFTQNVFDSGALTVLTTLFHHFPEAGDYCLFVQQGERLLHRTTLHVTAEKASLQINVDLATIGAAQQDCSRTGSTGYDLKVGGVMGFYASQGMRKYNIKIVQLGEKGKQILLDNRKAVPEGDFFAVTLVRPGLYKMGHVDSRESGEIHVHLPQGEKYRTDQVARVTVGKGGAFDPPQVKILSGQTVFFQCTEPARLRIELVKPAEGTERPLERSRTTYRKPPTKAPEEPPK